MYIIIMIIIIAIVMIIVVVVVVVVVVVRVLWSQGGSSRRGKIPSRSLSAGLQHRGI